MIIANSKTLAILWTASALVVIAFFFTAVYVRSLPGAAEQIALKAKRIELVHAVRIALAGVSEAQNSAVMSSADEDRRYFVAQAQAASSDLDHNLEDLKNALTAHRNQQQLELLSRVEEALREFDRLDKVLLDLAVQNSNRRAYALAIGPATKALEEMEAVLSRIVTAHDDATDENNRQILRLANGARISALHIRVLLLPHIAEEQDQTMDELEAQIAREDRGVVQSLESLSELLKPNDTSDIEKARSLYAEFDKLRGQIITLSRENTNVRSLSLSLNEKRQAMLAVQDSLAALQHAIESEEVATTIPLRR